MRFNLRLSNFKYALIISLILSAIILATAIYSLSITRTVREVESSISTLTKKIDLNQSIKQEFLINGYQDKEFLKTGSSKLLRLYNINSSQSDSLLSVLRLYGEGLGGKANVVLDELGIALNAFGDSFEKLIIALKHRGYKNYGVEGELRKAIHSIEKGKYSYDKVLMLTLRRNEKDFILRNDLKYVDKFSKNLKLFKSSISRSLLGASAKKSLLKKVDDYEKNFLILVEANKQIGNTSQTGILDELESSVVLLNTSLQSLLQIVKESADKEMELAIYILVIPFVFLITFLSLLIVSFNKTNKSIRNVVESVIKATKVLEKTSLNLLSSSGDLVSNSKQQSESSEMMSISVLNMSKSISLNSKNSKETKEMAQLAVDKISKSNDSVIETTQAMNNIAKKIDLINDIAKQTNLLALNASVEATRAGEHGKGFSVVANEVRKLANRTKQAAEEIQSSVNKGVTLADDTLSLLSDSIPDIKNTSVLVGEISDYTSDQSQRTVEITSTVEKLNGISQDNRVNSTEISKQSEVLSEQAETLSKSIKEFRL